MSAFRKIAKNVFSNWAGMIVSLIIAFFLSPYVVNKLGSTYYGIWVIMLQLTGYLFLLDFGIRESIIRFVSKEQATLDTGKLELVVNAALRVYGIVSLICLIVTMVFYLLFPYIFNMSNETVSSAQHVIIVSGINMAQFFIFNVYVGVLMGIQRYDIFNKINIVTALVRALLIVILLQYGYGIIALAYIQLLTNLFTNLVFYLYSQKLVPIKIRFNIKLSEYKNLLKSLITYSFFVLLNNICQKIIFYTDALVIGIFLPVSAITYYSIAGSLVEYLRKVVISMTMVLNPLTSEMEAKNEIEKIKDVLINGTKISFLIGTPICIVYFIFGQLFIRMWMGAEFEVRAGEVLMILAITQLFSLPHYSISSILYGLSKHHFIAYISVFEAISNLVLSLLLVKRYGIVGIALGTAIPHLIKVVFFLPIVISNTLDISLSDYFKRSYLGPLGSSILFIFLCYFSHEYLIVKTLIGFFALIFALLPFYLIPAWFFSFNREDRQWHLSIIFHMLRMTRR